VKIDPTLLKLSVSLRAHLTRQDADATKIDALHEKARDGAQAANDALTAALTHYEGRTAGAVAELTAACDDPKATASEALAMALYVRVDRDIHDRVVDNFPVCNGGLERDRALHPCGDVDPRVAHAFARAAELAPSSDPLALVARRGVAQTASAMVARAALEPLLARATGATRVALLSDLAVAYAAGREPDYDAAVRTAGELVPLLDGVEHAKALHAPPRRRPKLISLTDVVGDVVEIPDPPVLYVDPKTAIGAARLELFALSRTGRDREIVGAAIDLAARTTGGGVAVARLVADAVERSDDAALVKAPASLQRDVFEQLAARTLYRGDIDSARKFARRAEALGVSTIARAVLDAVAKYSTLPAPDASTAAKPDDLDAAASAHADPPRRFASYLRLCMEPFGGALGDDARFTLTIWKADPSGSRAIGSTGALPARAVDCLRVRAASAFMGIADGTVLDVSLLPPLTGGFGTRGLGLNTSRVGRGSEGIGLGNLGLPGHGGGSDGHHRVGERAP
jgi:hypothetical protein